MKTLVVIFLISCLFTFVSVPAEDNLKLEAERGLSSFEVTDLTNLNFVVDSDVTGSVVTTEIYFLISESQKKDVAWALETLLKHSPGVSTETEIVGQLAIYSSPNPAADLRRQADEIEQRDKDIIRARKILEEWKNIQ